MSLTAVTTKEMPQVEVGVLADRLLRRGEVETPPLPVPVNIQVTVTGSDSVSFKIEPPVDGVTIPASDPSTILVSKSSANLELVFRLDPASGFTYHETAILWVNPPQKGYGADPFGTQPIHRSDPLTAILPNSTGPKGSPKLTTPFALVLEHPAFVGNRTVVIDPTIVDDPNT
jgi:hypothetical protein